MKYGYKYSQSHSNRGKPFEDKIERTNLTYGRKNWGVFRKSEPPIKIERTIGNKIIGWKQANGFVDYFGISNGRSIAFEAKSTKERTRFDLPNVKQHQVDTLKSWNEQGGIAFLLIHFTKHFETYFVTFDEFYPWWLQQFEGGRRSIPHRWFVANCPLVKPKRGVPLDYLALIDLP